MARKTHENYRLLGIRIQAHMRLHRFTQDELAKAIGISPATLSQKFSGRVRMSALELAAISRILDVPMDELTQDLYENKPGSREAAELVDLRARRDSNPQPSDPNVRSFLTQKRYSAHAA